MLDCGIHPAYNGIAGLPYFDEVNAEEIDVLLVSHFHLDHAAGLPYFLKETKFRGRVFMTPATKTIYRLILQDYVKVSNISSDTNLYTEEDLVASMDRIDTINYHQVVHHKGIKFWSYNAGHVLGAAMFMIEIAGVRILYTGDYSRTEDRHLMPAELPTVKPDVLIVESTYGVQTLEPIADREHQFTSAIHNIVKRGGRCLVPVFALGRAQELLLILEEYWSANPALQNIPIYFASALARKCMGVYQTYVHQMNRTIQDRAAAGRNPFDFLHIHALRGARDLDDSGPSVVMASPGMMQNGLSRELFERWCTEQRNGVVIPGYAVEGTLAYDVKLAPREVTGLNGLALPLRMSVHYVSFSAHADFTQTRDFIAALRPAHVILVHGEANEMSRLKQALLGIYEDGSVRISSPRNCQAVRMEFIAQKVARVVGALAGEAAASGRRLAGVLVVKDFEYKLVDVDELTSYTPIRTVTVKQRLVVPFAQTRECLLDFLRRMFDVRDDDAAGEAAGDEPPAKRAKEEEEEGGNGAEARVGGPLDVHGAVTVSLRRRGGEAGPGATHAVLEWDSSPTNDMVVDSVVALMMSVESSPGSARVVGVTKCGHAHHHPPAAAVSRASAEGMEALAARLRQHFDDVRVLDGGEEAEVRMDDSSARLRLHPRLRVRCDDDTLRKRLQQTAGRIVAALFPLPHPEA